MNTKLSNGIEYFNPYFPASFGEYLLANKFVCEAFKNSIRFKTKTMELAIINDAIDLFKLEQNMKGADFKFTQCHIGIVQLDINGWIMLMHVMGVVTLQTFVKNAKEESAQKGTEADFIMKQVLKSQLAIA